MLPRVRNLIKCHVRIPQSQRRKIPSIAPLVSLSYSLHFVVRLEFTESFKMRGYSLRAIDLQLFGYEASAGREQRP